MTRGPGRIHSTLCRTGGSFRLLSRAHAVAHMIKLAPTLGSETILLVILSGRGDKDIGTVSGLAGITL